MLRTVFLILAMSTALMSCVTPVKISESPVNLEIWQQHIKQVKNIHQWNIIARISVQSKSDGGQAGLYWQQSNHDSFDIKLIAPLAGGSTHLQARPEGVLLSASDGQTVAAKNIEQLMQRVQAWHIPVNEIQSWLLGVPADNSKVELMRWNEQGLLYEMHQNGWRVEMRQYKKDKGVYLPAKLFLSRLNDEEELTVRIIVAEWNWQAEHE